ncbi:hypothetical protein SODALDRAFT_321931 [Sodiomyces alkalinus F11]|uniref:Uncharacterized protein n=1 Tax=Sodiomyces alkalinus (strain CBS 110278 / VKM F-3762 / F11) TaxID=1314773 RepID=A0A3N2Q1J1_SODAK|nr:hypothetical protein SODALDRAFT_321931 [Sodiomyces alkalinus F11]ROT40620.1 hypothetical protein SODALDRAFT_321931 [Sodiomyces alkalinus F11]
MEESPLTKAHDHARAAASATHQTETTVAINEHTLAAGEFAKAAEHTTSVEALRTLELLQEHHQRLSELLKLPLHRQAQPAEGHDKHASETTAGPVTEDAPAKSEQSGTSADSAKYAVPPSLTQKKRYPAGRPTTSSIATSLASARGIRSRNRGHPVPPSVTNDQAPGSLEVSPRKDGPQLTMQDVLDQNGRPGWVPPTAGSPRTDTHWKKEQEAPLRKSSEEQTGASEDGYSRFYNTFGTLINRLSAPLAFAGLPLIAEESSTATSQEQLSDPPTATAKATSSASSSSFSSSRRNKHKAPPSIAEPDLSKIYSRATMRAISANGGNPNESFYVVPTSGHTMSYANILSYADKEKRRLEASLHSGGDLSLIDEDEDDFVDARESPSGPPSPTLRRRTGGGRSRPAASGTPPSKTVEELALENKSLKDMLDKLSRRLHAFEASAQNSSLALAESMRFMRPGSPLQSHGGSAAAAGGDDAAALRLKNKELERQVESAIQRMEELEREHQKMERTIFKYREKWEQLKAGAKARRVAQSGTASVDNAANAARGEEKESGES